MLCTIELPRFAFADVAAGDTVGRLVFRCDLDGDGEAEKLADIPLSTSYAVPRRQKQPQWKRLWAWIFGIIRK
jgi:hypothetical protein